MMIISEDHDNDDDDDDFEEDKVIHSCTFRFLLHCSINEIFSSNLKRQNDSKTFLIINIKI